MMHLLLVEESMTEDADPLASHVEVHALVREDGFKQRISTRGTSCFPLFRSLSSVVDLQYCRHGRTRAKETMSG